MEDLSSSNNRLLCVNLGEHMSSLKLLVDPLVFGASQSLMERVF